MPDPPPTHPRPGPWPWILGAIAGLSVLLTLADPGITSDEPIDVKVGRNYLRQASRLVDQVGRRGIGSIDRADLDAFFADNAQHPPLGRWLLGLASTAFEPLEGLLGGPDPLSVHPARVAPMLAFALLVGLVSAEAGRRAGRPASVVAGLALLLMPRVFAHAHLATLDTFLALTWTLALLSAARAIESRRPVVGLALAGAAWGLAMLTKIHGWLLPPLVLGYALATLPTRKAIAGVSLWGLVGLLVLAVGWPWLWFDPAERLSRFLSTSVDRQPIRVLYLGRVTDDVDVPWHYPWAYFALTVPVGLLGIGLVGAARGCRGWRSDRFPILLLASIGLFLALFSTRAPVYDGERLFLLVFPSWALLVGLGFGAAWEASGPRRWPRALLVALVAGQGVGVVRMHPFQLSYYNAIAGGLAGAERLDLELTYWGDAVDPVLLEKVDRLVPPGSEVALAPTFHHLHPIALMTPGLFEDSVTLAPEQALGRSPWLVVFRRSAYWSPEVRAAVRGGRPLAERSRDGVWLSRLYRVGPAEGRSPPATPEDSFRTN
ncbi:glycosyltransferase family 39 protein [Tautonia plasticadhaerens]|uniref:Dolichyl-phosphate-mannose-protein mannosyltransferase n=1 Tax=Tautonia plasticadhaerens TaxID=2527974 RepID=A0A518GWE4_9BACT|nr:glycosyltransferase family 39 protein [Tautonia plasticadhaerens]QDV32908.1 Dolichyl-phosphate-mannose-protein mannosyltransferase [Tautonia plasticadhaerens]